MSDGSTTVLFVSHASNRGGAISSLLEIVRNLPSNIDPVVLTPSEGPLSQKLDQYEIPYITLAYSWWIVESKLSIPALPYQSLKNIKSFIQYKLSYIPEREIGVVYTNTIATPIGAIIAEDLDANHIWHIREFVEEDHGYTFTYGRKRSMDLIDDFSDWVIYNSKSVMSKHTEYVSNPNETVVYNGPIDSSQIKWGGHKDAPIYGTVDLLVVGAIKEGKNQREAVRTVHHANQNGVDTQLTIVGEGNDEYKHRCIKLAEELDISDQIHWEGYVDDVFQYYQENDILLVPSKSEAFGRIVVEAMSCGTPVIGRQAGALPELIQEDETGLLYTNIEELVENIKKLKSNHMLVRKISKNCINKVSEKFTTEKYSQNIASIIENCIDDSV